MGALYGTLERVPVVLLAYVELSSSFPLFFCPYLKLGASVIPPCPPGGVLGANLRVAMPLFSRLFLLGATDSGTCELV